MRTSLLPNQLPRIVIAPTQSRHCLKRSASLLLGACMGVVQTVQRKLHL